MSRIISGNAGFGLNAAKRATMEDLLTLWDSDGNDEELNVNHVSRNTFALYRFASMVFMGTIGEVTAYLRGMIHVKKNRVNL